MIEQLLNFEARNIGQLAGLTAEEMTDVSARIEEVIDFIVDNSSDFEFVEDDEESEHVGKTGIHAGKICQKIMSIAKNENEKVVIIATLRVSLEMVHDHFSPDPIKALFRQLR